MPRRDIKTIADHLYWSYANLAMAHAALSKGDETYSGVHFIVRARLYSGLQEGRMRVGSLIEDDRAKLALPRACCYCGAASRLSLDHLWPKSHGGSESSDNIVWCCLCCNSAKGARDVLDWLKARGVFPPLLLLRRYLKLAIRYCRENALMDEPLQSEVARGLPFSLESVPHEFPHPRDLILHVAPRSGPSADRPASQGIRGLDRRSEEDVS